jgi:hypothetical protein
MRLWPRRKEAIDLWRRETSAEPVRRSRRTVVVTRDPDGFVHAPDLDPSEVDLPRRVGFDGRELPRATGKITGLEGGGGMPPGAYGG